MAPPKGESGARTDTARGRAAEKAFQERKAADVATAAQAQRSQVLEDSVKRGELDTGQEGMRNYFASQPANDPDVYNYDTDPETMRMREQQRNQQGIDAAAERNRVNNVVTSLRGIMDTFGLTSLMGKIQGFVTSGLDGDAVLAMIRDTPEYKDRFPAMAAMMTKNRAITEAEYIDFERNAAQLERSYGLPAGMLGRDTVTNLLSNEVSAKELEQRVTLAAAGAFQTTPEMRDTFNRFYGISGGGLTAYFLDPDKALPLLNKQYAASQIGAEAQRNQFQIAASTAEQFTELGVTEEQARSGFGVAANQRGLMQGRGDTATQDELVSGNVAQNQEGLKAIERAQKSRTGRFEGGGAFTSGAGGVSGLGSSATR